MMFTVTALQHLVKDIFHLLTDMEMTPNSRFLLDDTAETRFLGFSSFSLYQKPSPPEISLHLAAAFNRLIVVVETVGSACCSLKTKMNY